MVAVIVALVTLGVGQGFAKLNALEVLNREKAVTLEKMCDRFAWTQPYAAAGSSAVNVGDRRVDIAYPHIVFGVACETNRFAQVTNCVLAVREDGVLQTVIQAGVVTGLKSVTNSMDWMDVLFVNQRSPAMASCAVSNAASDIVVVTLAYTNIVIDDQGVSAGLALSVPIKLRNSDYRN